jgi:hypothetical protein
VNVILTFFQKWGCDTNDVAIQFWSIVGANYHKMVVEVITIGKFYEGVTKGLIILLHKGEAQEDHSNWRPIILFNVFYMIYAKVL